MTIGYASPGVLTAVAAPPRYAAPRLYSRGGPARVVNEWIVILILLALAIIYYGSLWAFCVGVCGWGNVFSCAAQWGVWAQAVCY